jgi:hypothetical protein
VDVAKAQAAICCCHHQNGRRTPPLAEAMRVARLIWGPVPVVREDRNRCQVDLVAKNQN